MNAIPFHPCDAKVGWRPAIVAAACLLAGANAHGGCLAKETHQLQALDGAPGDGLGFSLATHGSVVVAGAWLDDDGGTSSGSAYVFDLVSGQQLFKLVAADPEPYDLFAWSVACGGGLALVGAPFENEPFGQESGAAYVFDTSTGEELFKLTTSESFNDHFGWSVAMSGDRAAIGAPFDAGGAGSVYVFDPGSGTELKKLTASDTQAEDFFGQAVAMSGGTLLIGTRSIAFSGALGWAYIFERDQGGPDNWGEVVKLTAPDGQIGDWFGSIVAIDADTAVIGSPRHGLGGLSNAGAAYVFERSQGGPDNWGLVIKLTAPQPAIDDHFGESVAVSGDLIVVGCPYDDGDAENTGAAYVFHRGQGGPDNWGLVSTLTASDAAWLDNLGNAVSIDGTRAVIGAAVNDTPAGSNAGAACVFDLECAICPADVNGDGTVAVDDLVAIIMAWGKCTGCPADVDGDGKVDVSDLVAAIANWGTCP
jgi:hypothetical protein